MSKKIKLLTLCLFLLFSFSFGSVVKASEQLNIYLFWGDGCPHCAKEKTFLSEVLTRYPNVKLNLYEIYHNQANVYLMQAVADKLDIDAGGVPFLVIGNQGIIGFSEGFTESEIENKIQQCLDSTCPDLVASQIDKDKITDSKKQVGTEQGSGKEEKIINLPFIGKINALDFSLPVLTIVIGALDGFNPCAMWVLLFLISLLLGFKDRKKMWLLGITFIVTSAFMYFLFMAAWLNIILFLGFIIWVRLAIGLVALVGGGYHIRKGIVSKDGGCEVTGDEKRRAVFEKLREIAKDKSVFLALGGIILLAFAVNLVELVCSAGFPAVYTQVLALSDLQTWQYYGYILLYILFFMLDDIIVFAIAMVTLKLTGISTKYTRYSNLIGGALMIIIGILLIIKPEWLMFG